MFHWLAELEDGSRLDESTELTLGLDTQFDSQEEAEAWLGDFWSLFGDFDIAQVSLLQGDELVFGPMGLEK
ncbi:MAG: hypothetical protein LBM94_02425 [Propionibacteriaceae bacterium]|jgi:hypothetical protein|nr:hypothetical protein [Propionibacteriaceae bacterium]